VSDGCQGRNWPGESKQIRGIYIYRPMIVFQNAFPVLRSPPASEEQPCPAIVREIMSEFIAAKTATVFARQ
jgi:hypothetical protein